VTRRRAQSGHCIGAITERTALYGHNHRETAILYNSPAISVASGNQLNEALAANQETIGNYRAIGLGDSIDAQIILANASNLELRMGHLK
jgi:hypothetical protein